MPDTQFKELCKRLQFVGGHMKYLDFVANFEDLREGGDVELIRVNNHHVNPIRGDEYGLSALEAESKLRNKLRENFEVSGKLVGGLWQWLINQSVGWKVREGGSRASGTSLDSVREVESKLRNKLRENFEVSGRSRRQSVRYGLIIVAR
jgi:hypothetical protein